MKFVCTLYVYFGKLDFYNAVLVLFYIYIASEFAVHFTVHFWFGNIKK